MSVRDQEENDIVFNLKALQEKRKSNGQKVWLGGSRASPSSPWQWTDGSDWGWQKWEPTQNEPNGFPDNRDVEQHCLQMYFGMDPTTDGIGRDDRQGFWNDNICHIKRPFICEKNKN